MAYHPLANDTGGSPDDRRSEADRILKPYLRMSALMHLRSQRLLTKEVRFHRPGYGRRPS